MSLAGRGEAYRNQFRPADFHSLSSNQLTKVDLVYGHGLMRDNISPQISLDYAVRQSHASCYCTNALLHEIFYSTPKEDHND